MKCEMLKLTTGRIEYYPLLLGQQCKIDKYDLCVRRYLRGSWTWVRVNTAGSK